jgi:hypothetical protein
MLAEKSDWNLQFRSKYVGIPLLINIPVVILGDPLSWVFWDKAHKWLTVTVIFLIISKSSYVIIKGHKEARERFSVEFH